MALKDRMTRLLANPPATSSDYPDHALPKASPALSTSPNRIAARMSEAVAEMLQHADLSELPGGLGMALPHLLPMMMRRLAEVPEPQLRAIMHALAAKLRQIADDEPDELPAGELVELLDDEPAGPAKDELSQDERDELSAEAGGHGPA